MPTYEYRCPNGHEFEKFFRTISSAVGEHPCPACGVIGVRQMSGGGGLMFKGSGFYLTDYGKNAHGKKAPQSKPASDSSGGGDGATTAGEGKTVAGAAESSAGGGSKADAPATGGDASARPSSSKPTRPE